MTSARVASSPAPPQPEGPLSSTGTAVVVCDQWLGSNGYAGMKALRRAGWSVEVAPEWEFVPARWRTAAMRALGRAIRPLAVREYNRELTRAVERIEADLLLVFKGTFVSSDAVRRCGSVGVRTYCFYPDVSFRAHGPYLPKALPLYDWVFTTKTFGVDDMREQLGVTNASVLMHAFDPDLHRPVSLTARDRARYGCDVSFIGSWSPKKEILIDALLTRMPALHLRIWGEQWKRARSAAVRSAYGGHPIVGEEYVRAIRASRINLGLLSEQRAESSSGDRITSRTFHIPASGGFLLHERTEEVDRLFEEGREIACFTTTDELAEQVQRYLSDDGARERVASNARQLVTSRDSWDHRIQTILDRHMRIIRDVSTLCSDQRHTPVHIGGEA